MPTPATSAAFGDLLDARFQEIFQENKDRLQLKDMIPTLYGTASYDGRPDIRNSSIGAFGDFTAFSGTVEYDDQAQGYDVTATPIEFASGFQVERKLFDDGMYNIMDQKPEGLALSAMRTRQKHAARPFTNGFSVDTMFYSHSEGLPLFSNSHTTTADGVSTASGFDNLVTTALSATAVAAARIQFRGFRDDRGNRFDSTPDELIISPDNYDVAAEIVGSQGKLDTSDNNINVHKGAYKVIDWNYLSDTNDWFMSDSTTRKTFLRWADRVPLEFAFAEDLDTIVAKWRAYMRYTYICRDWRWAIGAQVA